MIHGRYACSTVEANRALWGITSGLSGAGPSALKCKQDGPPRVHSRPIVRPHDNCHRIMRVSQPGRERR
jgi:hypothetical protein